jgi:endonuclease/exonuclease/phosphatase family metal-dependent hydrolase
MDHDVILARADVTTTPALARNFLAAVELPLPDSLSSVEILRGFVAVEASIGGRRGLFVNTHLETRAFPTIQVLQATELLLALGAQHGPVLLVGDFNSDPDGSSTPTYELITKAGFVDTWTRRLGPPEPGYTCCQAPDLRNEESLLHRRIDIVFGRGLGLRPSRVEVDAWVVGDEPADRTPSGLWPSDHAGVVTELRPSARP